MPQRSPTHVFYIENNGLTQYMMAQRSIQHTRVLYGLLQHPKNWARYLTPNFPELFRLFACVRSLENFLSERTSGLEAFYYIYIEVNPKKGGIFYFFFILCFLFFSMEG